MIALIAVCMIIPLIWGVVICSGKSLGCNAGDNESDDESVSWVGFFLRSFLYGFITFLSISFVWYFVYLILSMSGALLQDSTFRMSKLSSGCLIIIAVTTVGMFVVFFAGGGIKRIKACLENRSSGIENGSKKSLRENSGKRVSISFFITFIWCAFQILRVVIAQPTEYRDDRSYIALIGDIIYTDRIYGSQIDTGRLIDGPWEMQTKWLLSPWYHFIAFVTRISGMHPTIVYKTIMPAFVMLLVYIALYELGRALELHNKSLWIYMLICVASFEALSGLYDPATGFLVWPMWGKNPAALVVIPMIYVVYTKLTDKFSFIHCLLLAMLGIVGCGMTATCMMVIPIELGVLAFIHIVGILRDGNKNRIWELICATIVGCIPPVIEFILYTGISRGWLL